ncbi:hypothetical protein [Pengzhenrongella sp.]|jgi:hypothetical protein|uniref:hypothetical protein n=1 Tax=Pengzhenrongella sp. TaxID=2888820 RepID=UPI002F94D662
MAGGDGQADPLGELGDCETSVLLQLRARPAAARAVSRFSGVAMVGIGVLLLAEQLAS